MMRKIGLFLFVGALGTVAVAMGGAKAGGHSRIPAKEVPAGPTVRVEGQVKRVGPVEFHPRMTVLQALQAAGGITPFGTRNRVYLTRGKNRITLDLRKPEHQSRLVMPGDSIVVDQKGRNMWR